MMDLPANNQLNNTNGGLPDMHGGPLVEMVSISKAYPGCLANDAIGIEIHSGRVHALLGENGAGKSTLVKILYGLLAQDSGNILWQGKSVDIASPAIARELGIAMVFQHFSLFESLSVLENIALGMDADADSALKEKIIEVSVRYGLPLDPDRSVYSLSVGERQRIEIVRCLLQEPKLLIMDEPTSVLTPLEVSELFETLSRLADEGVAILYISHKLEEIRQLCHEATILRGGRKVATADPREESAQSLAALMMGSDIPAAISRKHSKPGSTLLELSHLDHPAQDQNGISLRAISLSVRAGEIVGIAGVAGNGQDELMQVIAGEILLASDDSVLLHNKKVGQKGAGERRRRGLCCVPEERLGHAAVPSLSLVENAFLTAHHRKALRPGGLVSYRRSREFAEEIIQKFNVQCNGPMALAGSLSGGNLQKFIVGREILQAPDVLVVSQPTWGVDAGAASAIHEALRTLAAEGAAILLISQDLDELMQSTDRIGALCAGRLSDLYITSDVTVQQVGLLMGGETIDQVKATRSESI
jgi:ABC-type uncharacterized transport system ATPase subunit